MSLLDSILKTGYVDPEVLKELDDEEKQVLFYTIRNEQRKRYDEYEKELQKNPENASKMKNGKKREKKVTFLQGKDQNVWVWVMGDHQSDKTIEQMLEEEAERKAEQRAEAEVAKLRKIEEEALARAAAAHNKVEQRKKRKSQNVDEDEISEEEYMKSVQKYKAEQVRRRSSIKDIERLKTRRTSQILESIQEDQQKSNEEAKKTEPLITKQWQKQEEKAKRLENRFLQQVKKARQETDQKYYPKERQNELQRPNEFVKMVNVFRRSSIDVHFMNQWKEQPLSRQSWHPSGAESKSLDQIVKWYRNVEIRKGSGFDKTKSSIAVWFHGPITTDDAEDLLEEARPKTFLVRLSRHDLGYAISYRTEEKCKHLYVSVKGNQYKIIELLGAKRTAHKSLLDLINHYKINAIHSNSEELLEIPFGQVRNPPDYSMLFEEEKTTRL